MMCIRICLIQLRIYVYFWITWGVCFAINWREVLGETENSGPDQMPMCEDRCHDEVSLIITTLTYLCEDLSMSYLPSSLLFDSCIRLCIFQLVHSDHWVGRQWGILPFSLVVLTTVLVRIVLWKRNGSDISGASYQQNVTNWKFQTCLTYGSNPLDDVWVCEFSSLHNLFSTVGKVLSGTLEWQVPLVLPFDRQFGVLYCQPCLHIKLLVRWNQSFVLHSHISLARNVSHCHRKMKHIIW